MQGVRTYTCTYHGTCTWYHGPLVPVLQYRTNTCTYMCTVWYMCTSGNTYSRTTYVRTYVHVYVPWYCNTKASSLVSTRPRVSPLHRECLYLKSFLRYCYICTYTSCMYVQYLVRTMIRIMILDFHATRMHTHTVFRGS